MKSDIDSNVAILPEGTRAYFQDRLRTRLYDLVIRELEAFKARGMTQAQLAVRIGKRAEQVSRWLSSPGNLTLDTVSDLLLGISGAELGMVLEHPTKAPPRNRRRPMWLEPNRPHILGGRAIEAGQTAAGGGASTSVKVGGDGVLATYSPVFTAPVETN
jgi:hypothetical protein